MRPQRCREAAPLTLLVACVAVAGATPPSTSPAPGESKLPAALSFERPPIAVLTLAGKGPAGKLPADDLAFFTNAVRDGFAAASTARVLSAEHMERAFATAGFKPTKCTSGCEARAAEVLGVERMVLGELRRSSGGTFVVLRLTDQKTGEIVAAHSDLCQGCDDAGLASRLQQMGKRLGKALTPALPAAPPPFSPSATANPAEPPPAAPATPTVPAPPEFPAPPVSGADEPPADPSTPAGPGDPAPARVGQVTVGNTPAASAEAPAARVAPKPPPEPSQSTLVPAVTYEPPEDRDDRILGKGLWGIGGRFVLAGPDDIQPGFAWEASIGVATPLVRFFLNAAWMLGLNNTFLFSLRITGGPRLFGFRLDLGVEAGLVYVQQVDQIAFDLVAHLLGGTVTLGGAAFTFRILSVGTYYQGTSGATRPYLSAGATLLVKAK